MSHQVNKTYPRLWTIEEGVIMVVADLHGDWEAYQRYRDRFFELRAAGQADILVFLGDLIHAEGTNIVDQSLEIVLDVKRLQAEHGTAVLYLCGNHELPHMYGFGLGKGNLEYTPHFETRLTASNKRHEVLDLFYSLPLYIRTKAGVSLAHAGASQDVDTLDKATTLFNWDHKQKLAQATELLQKEDIAGLQRSYAKLSGGDRSYKQLVKHYMGVRSEHDPRYNVLLRGIFAQLDPEYDLLYTALFTKCENEYGTTKYRNVLKEMLTYLGTDYVPQQILVAGHINVIGGHQTIVNKHLRLTSNYHVKRRNGVYLLFNASQPIKSDAELVSNLHKIW